MSTHVNFAGVNQIYRDGALKFAPGIVTHIIIQVISPTIIQAILLHVVLSGVIVSAAVRASSKNESLETEYSSRLMAYLIMMVKLLVIMGGILLVGFAISSSLQERLPDGTAGGNPVTTYKGLAVTAVVMIFALTRFWPYFVLPFIYPDTPVHLGARRWYLGFDRRKKMLAQLNIFRSASLPAVLALVCSAVIYLWLIGLDHGVPRSVGMIFLFGYLWPLAAIIVAQAGLRAALRQN